MTVQSSTAWGKLEIENSKCSDYPHLAPVPLRSHCLLPKVGIMLQHQIKLLCGQTKFRDMKAAYSHQTP